MFNHGLIARIVKFDEIGTVVFLGFWLGTKLGLSQGYGRVEGAVMVMDPSAASTQQAVV